MSSLRLTIKVPTLAGTLWRHPGPVSFEAQFAPYGPDFDRPLAALPGFPYIPVLTESASESL
jgi:hypothetical protein